MDEGYLYTLLDATESLFKDRGSKFLGFACPVEDEAAVEAKLAEIKKQYHDARHHCYAYRLGKRGETTFAQDDGEPSHSAGDPILGAIRSAELTQVLVVVVRYFGGTKLGVRGLIEAYRSAAETAIAANRMEAVIPKVTFAVTYPYEQTSDFNRVLHPFTFEVVEATYTDHCRQVMAIPEAAFPVIKGALEAARFELEILASG